MLALASAAGFLAAFAISTAAFARIPIQRGLRVVTVLAVIVVSSRVIIVSGLRLNVTPSMPVGIYRLAPVPQTGLQRGMLVAVCAPLKAAQLGRRRAYLSGGQCAGDTEPLLKTVVAIAGDSVCDIKKWDYCQRSSFAGQQAGVVRQRRTQACTVVSRILPTCPTQVWLYADHPKSWDSRYWGPVGNVLARVIPLATMPRDPR